jgi:hypothetical protein
VNDILDGELIVNPIDPPLFAEFVVITPARRTLSTQARLFLEQFKAEVTDIETILTEAMAATDRRTGRPSRSRQAKNRRRSGVNNQGRGKKR